MPLASSVLVLLQPRCHQCHALHALLNTCLLSSTKVTEWDILPNKLLKPTAPDSRLSAYRTTIRRPRFQCTCLVSSSTLRQLDRLHGCENNSNTRHHHSPRTPPTACKGTRIWRPRGEGIRLLVKWPFRRLAHHLRTPLNAARNFEIYITTFDIYISQPRDHRRTILHFDGIWYTNCTACCCCWSDDMASRIPLPCGLQGGNSTDAGQ
jgi:hypothetical protein